jgi:type III restriction enzyme, res subunit family
MNNTLIDNSTDALSMQTYLKQCIGKEGIDHIRIATGYWDVPGMALVADELRAFLEREGTRLQILIGKDPNVYASHLKDPTQKFPDDYIKTDLLRLLIKEEYKLAVDLLLTHCKHTETDDDGQEIEVGTGRIEVNKYTEDKGGEDVFLHSKCYIFMGSDSSFGIIGSSNFTRKGLTQNAELNYLETNGMIITAEPKEGSPSKGHRIWFDEKWEQSAPWTNEFVNEIVKPSPIGQEVNRERKQRQKEEEEALAKPFTPYELYIKALQICFGRILRSQRSCIPT